LRFVDWAAVASRHRKKKQFFFEKKNQKTLILVGLALPQHISHMAKSLGLSQIR